ncbi:MAG: hypothetical protein QOF53_1015 [Nocardioidaceae bacterium]|jgi:hypothetical protein|nr:hypothetical protein [Nocardioidaceae bacterium]
MNRPTGITLSHGRVVALGWSGPSPRLQSE